MQIHNNLLPSIFNTLFTTVNQFNSYIYTRFPENSLIIFQKKEQIMVSLTFDWWDQKFGIPIKFYQKVRLNKSISNMLRIGL
jgi:hypothetical protein